VLAAAASVLLPLKSGIGDPPVLGAIGVLAAAEDGVPATDAPMQKGRLACPPVLGAIGVLAAAEDGVPATDAPMQKGRLACLPLPFCCR